MVEIETKRLTLRGFKYSDLSDFYQYAKDPEIGPSAGWKPHTSMEETKQILESFIEKEEVWAIVDKETNHVIGSIGIHDKGKECRELGYVLSKSYWGHGIMLEGALALIDWYFKHTSADFLRANHFPSNLQSKRVLEKLNFQFVQVHKNYYKNYNGELLDSYEYILRKEKE